MGNPELFERFCKTDFLKLCRDRVVNVRLSCVTVAYELVENDA
jgi:hypothetical protein